MATDLQEEFRDIIDMALSQVAGTDEHIDFVQLYDWKNTRAGKKLVRQLEQNEQLQDEIYRAARRASEAFDRMLDDTAKDLTRRYGPTR